MHIDLSGRTALVTGSTGGIGHAAVRGFAAAGANIVVNGREETKVTRTAEQLQAEFPSVAVTGVAASLDCAAGVEALIAGAPNVDILVNNVALNVFKDIFEPDDDLFLYLYELNFMSGLRLTRHYLPKMIEKGRGRVIFCGSESALRPSPDMIAYAASKTAQLSLARAFAEKARGTAVTVNTVMIGPTRSAAAQALHHKLSKESGRSIEQIEADFIASYSPRSLLGRIADAEEVANMIIYLASDQASATRGAIVSAEGGVREVVFL